MIFKREESLRPKAMNSSLSTIWSAITHLGLGKPTVAESALLILLVGSLLALRTFHDRYLRLWVVGWIALVGSRLATGVFASLIPAQYVQVVAQAAFMLAVGLLAGA